MESPQRHVPTGVLRDLVLVFALGLITVACHCLLVPAVGGIVLVA